MKTCTRCGETKNIVAFQARNRNGRLYRPGQCARCEHELRAIYRRTLAGRTSDKRAHDKYYTNNRDKVLESFKTEKFKEVRQRYNKTEKARTRTVRFYESEKGQDYLTAKWLRHSAKRRLRIEQTEGLLTIQEWRAIKAAYQDHCAYCDKKTELTLDHVIPLSKQGVHSKDNVVPACWPCNNKKHAQLGWKPNPPRQPVCF